MALLGKRTPRVGKGKGRRSVESKLDFRLVTYIFPPSSVNYVICIYNKKIQRAKEKPTLRYPLHNRSALADPH